MAIKVVFPAPLCPKIENNSPSFTSKKTYFFKKKNFKKKKKKIITSFSACKSFSLEIPQPYL